MTHRTSVSGQALINDFRTVLLTAATSEAATHEAKRSENALMQHLQDISQGFLQPGSIAHEDPERLSRASLDAHIKKIQAQQYEQLNAAQREELQQQAAATYQGRRVQVTVNLPERKPIEAVWADPRTGFRTGTTRRRNLTGVIDEVRLDQNVILIRPARIAAFFNSQLRGFLIYIIDPETLAPMVDLNF
jgi:hypothetical protein